MTDSQLPPPEPHQRQAPTPYAGGQSMSGQYAGGQYSGGQYAGGQYSGGQPPAPTYAGGQPYAQPTPRSRGGRVAANLTGILLSIVLTPIGIGLLGHFSFRRYRETQVLLNSDVDVLSLLGIVAGLLLLFLVAASAGWAPAGPFLAGLLFGVMPGMVFLIAPMWSIRRTFDLPSDVGAWLSTYGTLNLLLTLGLLLVGAGLAGALARRAGRRSV